MLVFKLLLNKKNVYTVYTKIHLGIILKVKLKKKKVFFLQICISFHYPVTEGITDDWPGYSASNSLEELLRNMDIYPHIHQQTYVTK